MCILMHLIVRPIVRPNVHSNMGIGLAKKFLVLGRQNA